MPEHIMRWPSPWSDGFPGWHCECTAMGASIWAITSIFMVVEWTLSSLTTSARLRKLLPHKATNGEVLDAQQYDYHKWTEDGKSLGNFITLEQFFTGIMKRSLKLTLQ